MTWPFGILWTLHHSKLRGSLPLFLFSFHWDCHFHVYFSNALSHPHQQENGVPQGSLLSVILFAFSINDIANVVGLSITTSLYVDNIAIFCASSCLDILECWLQVVIKQLPQWALESNFSFSVAKTQCVYFTCRHIKFSGLVSDSKLSWESHLWQPQHKCVRTVIILQVLSRLLGNRDTIVLFPNQFKNWLCQLSTVMVSSPNYPF